MGGVSYGVGEWMNRQQQDSSLVILFCCDLAFGFSIWLADQRSCFPGMDNFILWAGIGRAGQGLLAGLVWSGRICENTDWAGQGRCNGWDKTLIETRVYLDFGLWVERLGSRIATYRLALDVVEITISFVLESVG